MSLSTLNDLLIDQLRDIYFAEKHLTKALPKMAKAANHPELRAAFENHLEETRGHVERLESVFEMLETPARAKRCPAMLGLIEEGSEMINEDAEPDVKDAGLIAAAQRVEHYEIAAYGCARAFAKRLGLRDIERVLTQTIEEEGACDQALTRLAEGHVNTAAMNAGNEEQQSLGEEAGRSNGRSKRSGKRDRAAAGSR